VAAWPHARDEVRIAFDRPVDPTITSRLAGITLDAGEYVRAADRFEVLKPPYEVVKEQLAAGWRNVKIGGATLSNDARTLIVKTEELPWRAWYAVGIPGVLPPGASGLGETIDLDFDLAGLDAQWQSDDGKTQWTGWLPHPDPAVMAALLRGSAEHETLLSHLQHRGRLVLKSRLQLPGKTAKLRLKSSSGDLTLSIWQSDTRETRRQTNDGSRENRRSSSSRSTAKVEQSEGDADVTQGIDLNNGGANFELSVRTGDRPLSLSMSYHTDVDPTERPLPVEAFLVPWAPDERQPMKPKAESPLTAGGNWEAGKALYFGEAKCSTCHTIRNEGGRIGPNLSNLVHLDPESVLKHILDPNATINPDHVNYNVRLKNGDTLAGLVYNEGPDHYRVTESFEKSTVVKKSDVETLKPLTVSIMPEGYKDLGEQKLKDLLTYLTKEK
jgi:putative heme-binding domain-containing protein